VGLGTACSENAAKQLRQAMRLGNGGGRKSSARVETFNPAIAPGGLLYAKQRPRIPAIGGYIFEGRRHAATLPLRSKLKRQCKLIRLAFRSVELAEVGVLGLHPAHRAGRGAHHHSVGEHGLTREAHTFEQ